MIKGIIALSVVTILSAATVTPSNTLETQTAGLPVIKVLDTQTAGLPVIKVLDTQTAGLPVIKVLDTQT
ncbi:hypothetical protein, partial [Shewanella aestuarii]